MGTKARYAFRPVGMDAYDPKPEHPNPGTHVVLSEADNAQQAGAKRGRLGAFRFVENAETGESHGMVHKNSLMRVTRFNPNPGGSDPTEMARAHSLFNDRRAY